MENGDYHVSNSCLSHNVASKNLPTTNHTFFPFFDYHVFTGSKHQDDYSDTSDEAQNPSGFSVEKHSINFVASNVV